MSGNFYPPEGHDFVNTADIRKLNETNSHLLEATYQDQVNIFRAGIFKKMAKHGLEIGPGQHLAWAMFDASQPGRDGGLDLLERPREILILICYHPQAEGSVKSSVRIITNDSYRTDEALEVMSVDITLDHENDMWHFIDATNKVDDPQLKKTLAQVFAPVGDSQLLISENFRPKTPLVNIQDGDIEIMPFGTHINLEDKTHTLELAREVFAEVADLEPVSCAIVQ